MIEAISADKGLKDPGTAVVRSSALRKFGELVCSLGGDPNQLLSRAQIEPRALANRHALIAYRSLVHLLERASLELNSPDLGMRLALMQGGTRVCGPLEYAMNNCDTVRNAFCYCADHMQTYSPAAEISMEEDAATGRTVLRFDILLDRLLHQRQAVEHALLMTQRVALTLTSGRAWAREVWFCHEPGAAEAVYRQNFRAVVRFGQPRNGLVFLNRDLALPIVDPDPQLYELAVSFIEARFPAPAKTITARVKTVVARILADKRRCNNEHVAAELGLSVRALQRRLQEEGQSLNTLKDGVRRDAVLKYLARQEMSFTMVADALGYSESSVLSRSCYRWFGASPRELRKRLRLRPH